MTKNDNGTGTTENAVENGQKIERKPQGGGGDKYYLVMFAARGSENEPSDIVLMLNGKRVVCKRDTEVILPEGFLKVADDAILVKTVSNPNNINFRKTFKVKKYPYSKIREATREEFFTMLHKNTEIEKEVVQKREENGTDSDMAEYHNVYGE